jgi:hypothetical protein
MAIIIQGQSELITQGKGRIGSSRIVYIMTKMNVSSSERLVLSVALGFAVIFNLIGSSRFGFYPTDLLVAAALGVGIVMVFGSGYYFMREPRWSENIHICAPELHTVKHVNASPC